MLLLFFWGVGGGRCFDSDGTVVQDRNVSNDCAFNQTQKQCFTALYYFISFVYFYLCYLELSNCPFYCRIRVTQSQIFILYFCYKH